ncbi:MAG: membrane protein insertase YidC [Nitrospirae bacterium]|nr:MAG: membrane protein insertase YidC [Nitrospirota bacterium]
MMDNRTLIAIVLSIAVILGFQFLMPAPTPVAPPSPPVADKAALPKEAPAKPAPPVSVPVAPVVPGPEVKDIRVENDLFTAVLSSKGGTVKFWELKAFKDNKGKEVVILSKPGVLPAVSIGADTNFELSGVNFHTTAKDIKLDSTNKTGVVVFEYAREGVSVRRIYTFHHGAYDVELTDEVSGLSEYWITLGSDFGILEKDDTVHVGPALLTGTDLKEFKPEKLKVPEVFKESLKWIAQEDKYFFAALAPVTPVEEARAWLFKDAAVVAFKGKPGQNSFRLYAGPKEHDRLAALNLGLEHVIDFGFFSIIARPLFWVLKFIYRFIGNYGWAIILLTIAVRVPFIPIINKGQSSMKKMQEIQPKMAEIKEKYKNDPKKMQTEMTELYKKYKVNPVGGCLPMLLQIPVFLALYKVLLISIELRNAPFMFWIQDLAAPDTLLGHIPGWVPLIGGFAVGPLPIAMGITMVIQQKMTPSSMDPKQAKMMMWMPVVFTFMFLNFASGLVLYWLVNNILGIAQQYAANRKLAQQTD